MVASIFVRADAPVAAVFLRSDSSTRGSASTFSRARSAQQTLRTGAIDAEAELTEQLAVLLGLA